MSATRRRVAGLAGLLVLASLPAPLHARPLYFENFARQFGFQEGDGLYACGVCHRRWEGGGPRNPFGQAVEGQVYLGKPILDALQAVLAGDADGDGFSNGDEIAVHRTLPGYACDNFTIALETPATFQALITPGVPSCLEPKDIRVDPAQLNYLTEVGDENAETVTIFNNGKDFPLAIAGYGVAGAAAGGFRVTGPASPLTLPVGASIALTVTFAPTASAQRAGTVQIQSDDPDEAVLTIAVSGLGFVRPLAPAPDRAVCLRDVQRAAERYAKTHLREWSDCFLAELAGRACDTGGRDRRVARAAARLRAAVGGKRDRRCARKTLTPARLGMATTCGGSCGAIRLDTLPALASCLVCRQAEATQTVLQAAIGAASPDVPGNRPGPAAYRCNQQVAEAMGKGIQTLQSALGRCELANITAASPVACATSLASTLAAAAAAVDGRLAACPDTAGMAGCRFVKDADPACLGATTTAVATALAGAVFAEE